MSLALAAQAPAGAADTEGVKPLKAILGRAFDPQDDPLAEDRADIAKVLSAMGTVALGGLAAVHLAAGRPALAALNAGVSLLLASLAWTLHRGRRPWVPMWAVVGALAAAIVLSTAMQGVPGVLWAYPALFLSFFVLPRAQAQWMSLVVIGSSCAVSYQALGPGLTLRLLVSMGFVLLMIQVVLGVLGRLQRRLLEQAITDPLTGTYNRRHLQTQLDRLNLPPGETRGPTPALLAIDIDHFKRINDAHGHATGDAVLRALVALIGSRQRLGDVLFRTGGEEFMLLLPRTPPAAAQALAEELRRRVEAAALLPDRPVTVSIGIASLRHDGGVDTWLRAADAALYRAKQGGRNRVELAP